MVILSWLWRVIQKLDGLQVGHIHGQVVPVIVYGRCLADLVDQIDQRILSAACSLFLSDCA